MKSKLHTMLGLMRYATVAVVASATAFVVVDHRDPGIVPGHGMYDDYVYTFGWPLVAGTHQISEPMLLAPPQGMERIEHWDINWLALAIDLLAYVSVVACTFIIARFFLPLIRFGRISLFATFVAMTISALLVLLLTWEFDPTFRLFALISTPVGNYYPITLYPLWISIPVLYGASCVLFLIANFLGTSTRRITI